MANVKISALSALGATPAGTDVLPITDVSGTPTTKKVTVTNLMGAAPVQSVAGRTGAVTIANTDVSGLGTAATLNVGTADTNVVQLADVSGTVKLPAVDGSQLTNVSGTDATKLAIASNLSDLNNAGTARTNLGLGTAATKNTGTSNGNVVELDSTGLPAVDGSQLTNLPSPDVSGPITTALRGTDDPHIGANPDQSFKVMDNPDKSAMVVADADGNITYLLKSSSAAVKVAKASGSAVSFALTSDLPAFVLENDSGEPDIEVTDSATGEKISVISGDSDTKGANGLPFRQGFNLPDIGANPAPLLISGGSIA